MTGGPPFPASSDERLRSISDGRLHSINVSNGGVPKTPRDSVRIRAAGLDGDRQRDLRYHGGPLRAVSLYSLDLIRALQSEGHPIDVGSIGENLTLAGVSWPDLTPGAEVEVGDVTLRLTKYAHPCQKIGYAFRDGAFERVAQKAFPGWSRLYASVVKEGTVRVGDAVRVTPALTPSARSSF